MTDFICASIDGCVGRTLLSLSAVLIALGMGCALNFQNQLQEQGTRVAALHGLSATSSDWARSSPEFQTLHHGKCRPEPRAPAHTGCCAKCRRNPHAARVPPIDYGCSRARSNNSPNSRAAPTTTTSDVRLAIAAGRILGRGNRWLRPAHSLARKFRSLYVRRRESYSKRLRLGPQFRPSRIGRHSAAVAPLACDCAHSVVLCCEAGPCNESLAQSPHSEPPPSQRCLFSPPLQHPA